MKILSKILLLLSISLSAIAQDVLDYQAIIQPCVNVWQDQCISHLTTQEIVTITDMLLLSYQVVQASFIMSQARLVIQSELFNIATLSINDTFDARLQAQNNDLTNIKNAVIEIEHAQEQIKSACNTLKEFGPLLINIDPTTIQLFIANLKGVILNWAKSQNKTIADFEIIKEELIAATDLFSQIKTIFNTVVSSQPVEHNQLLHGTNSLMGMYKKVEIMLADLTIIRQESITNFNTLLTVYFKYHYEVLYDYLQNIDAHDFDLMATEGHTLPHPEQVFILT